MGRAAACSKEDKEGLIIRMDLKKGAWTAEEDEKLVCFIRRNKGHGSWRTLPTLAGLDRCGKSCRLRWTNYLRPNIKRGNFSAEEERIILQLHAVVGNKWSTIASHLPGRTDNEVKNHWNTHLKKRLAKMGIDPVTHLPLKFLLPHHHTYGNLTSPHLWHSDWQKALLQQCLQLDSSIASHLVQWELARLEAEARQQLVNTHGAYIQNYYASFQQSLQQNLQQNQAPPFNMNDLIHAWNLQLQATSGSLTNSSNVLSTKPHIEDSQSHDNSTFLKNLYPSLFQATDLNPSIVDYTSTGTIDKESTIPNDETVEHILDDHVHTIASASVATSDTCSTSDTISSQLNPNQFVLLDDFDFDLYANASYNTTTNNDSHNSSPLANDDLSQHDSYWHRMLNLCSHVTFDEL